MRATTPTRVEGELGTRWGSGEAEILHAGFVAPDGATQSLLTTMEPATIRIDYEAHRPLQDIVVGFRIDTVHGQLVWGTSTRLARKTIGLADGPGTVELAIDELPAARGRLRPVGLDHRQHRTPRVRPLGATRALRGSPVRDQRRRAVPHARRLAVLDHRSPGPGALVDPVRTVIETTSSVVAPGRDPRRRRRATRFHRHRHPRHRPDRARRARGGGRRTHAGRRTR